MSANGSGGLGWKVECSTRIVRSPYLIVSQRGSSAIGVGGQSSTSTRFRAVWSLLGNNESPLTVPRRTGSLTRVMASPPRFFWVVRRRTRKTCLSTLLYRSLFLPYPQARIYCEDTGNHGKEFTA